MREKSPLLDLFSVSQQSPLPAAFCRTYHQAGPSVLALLMLAFGGEGRSPAVTLTVTGVSPLALVNALAKPIRSLTQYGKCVQAGTPTPDAPVDIMCNNGRVIAGNCISNIPDGQGTFITPSDSNTTCIYKAFPTDLVAGRSYTVTVTGANWSIIVQRKKPDGTDWSNVSAWVTTYELVPEAGYVYGIAIRIGGGTANITPADFNGTLTLDTTDGKPWADGAPETLTVSAEGEEPQTVNDVPMLLSVGDYADEVELISGLLTRNCTVIVLTGNEDWLTSNSIPYKHYCHFASSIYGDASTMAPLSTHFKPAATPTWEGLAPGEILWEKTSSGHDIDIYTDGIRRDDFKALLAAQYAAGTPVLVVVPQATTTEQTTPRALRSYAGTTTVSWTAGVSGTTKTIEYKGETASNAVGTAKVGAAKVA